MNRKLNKIRHIQEANVLMEKRLLKEEGEPQGAKAVTGVIKGKDRNFHIYKDNKGKFFIYHSSTQNPTPVYGGIYFNQGSQGFGTQEEAQKQINDYNAGRDISPQSNRDPLRSSTSGDMMWSGEEEY